MSLSQEGYINWGNFFYNVSYAVTELDSCSMSSANNYFTVMGLANAKGIIMLLDKDSGLISKFYTIDYIGTYTTAPVYKVYGAMYFDESENYIYASFLFETVMMVVRMKHQDEPVIDYVYQYPDSTTVSTFTPRIITFDREKADYMYIMGSFLGQGVIMLRDKDNFRMRWMNLYSTYMEDIYSYSPDTTTDDIFYVCGKGTGTANMGAVTRMTNDGDVKWFYNFGTTAANTCNSVLFKDRMVYVLLESAATEYQSSAISTYSTDMVLFRLSDGGSYESGRIITWSNYAAATAKNFLHINDAGQFLWTGYASGFSTKFYQSSQQYNAAVNFYASGTTTAYPDWFIMKWLWDQPDNYECLFQTEVSRSQMSGTYNRVSSPATQYQSGYDFTKKREFFAAYSSPYSGGFELKGGFAEERPCAAKSFNATPGIEYFYGQTAFDFKLNDYDYDETVRDMLVPEMIFENGTIIAANFSWIDTDPMSIFVQTNNQDDVDVHRTTVRGCDSLNNLLQFTLYINVSTNSAPEFVSTIQTYFTIGIDETQVYALPYYYDPEGNDIPELLLSAMPGFDYPEFVTFNNDSLAPAFTIAPDQNKWKGTKHYFAVVLKEKNSDFMKNIEYITVNVTGIPDPIDNNNGGTDSSDNSTGDGNSTEANKTQIIMKIDSIETNSTGVFSFSEPVHTQLVLSNFEQLFKVYVQNINKEILQLEQFEIQGVENNTNYHFQATFKDPYLLGLLNKKKDYLYIEMLNGTNETLLLNMSTEEFVTNKTSKQIDMQFDFRESTMAIYRQMAVYLYWIMIVIIAIQFFILFFKDVSFLPLWTLIEYMQLVGFMPIYNFKLIPYLYDAFKPFLVSHLILFENFNVYEEFAEDYFNINYVRYKLSVGKLLQSLVLIVGVLSIVIIIHVSLIVMNFMTMKRGNTGGWVSRRLGQFKFNAYLRLFMLVYFDFTFFSVMKILEGNHSTMLRKIALTFSYLFLAVAVLVPVLLVGVILKKHKQIQTRVGKERFNTLMLKIDKASRWRNVNIAFFFGRRLLTAILLCLPITTEYIFLQYVFVLVSSHAYILYMVAVKPYQTPMMNTFVLMNETFYSALIILIFIFSDATPQLSIKLIAGYALHASIFLLVIANLIFIGYSVKLGKPIMKERINIAKKKRIEREEQRRKEDEERRRKAKEEELVKLGGGAEDPNVSAADGTNNTFATGMHHTDIGGKGGIRKGKGAGSDFVYDNDKLEQAKPHMAASQKKKINDMGSSDSYSKGKGSDSIDKKAHSDDHTNSVTKGGPDEGGFGDAAKKAGKTPYLGGPGSPGY